MKPVEYQNILAVDHLEKGYNYISSKGEKVSCPVLEKYFFSDRTQRICWYYGTFRMWKNNIIKSSRDA